MTSLSAVAAPSRYAPIRIIDVSPIRTILALPIRRRSPRALDVGTPALPHPALPR